MRTRKTAADQTSSRETTLRRDWGSRRRIVSEFEDEEVSLRVVSLCHYVHIIIINTNRVPVNVSLFRHMCGIPILTKISKQNIQGQKIRINQKTSIKKVR